jgi:hypothetical protein
MGDRSETTKEDWAEGLVGAERPESGVLPPADQRLIRLIQEFRRRQRRCPDLVVRPWWTQPGAGGATPRLGFVMEYCPGGRASAELVVRADRVTVEGPRGAQESRLNLKDGWELDGTDTGSPETLANHLLRLADRLLEEDEAA